MEKNLRKMLSLAYKLNGRAVGQHPRIVRACSELLDHVIAVLEMTQEYEQRNTQKNLGEP